MEATSIGVLSTSIMISKTIYADSSNKELLSELLQAMGESTSYYSTPSQEGEPTWFIKVPKQEIGFFAWGHNQNNYSPISELQGKASKLGISLKKSVTYQSWEGLTMSFLVGGVRMEVSSARDQIYVRHYNPRPQWETFSFGYSPTKGGLPEKIGVENADRFFKALEKYQEEYHKEYVFDPHNA